MRHALIVITVAVAAIIAAGPVQSADAPVATVGKQAITRAQLDQHVRPKLIELDQQRYDALREGLDELIGEALIAQEAAALGITAEALTKKEIDDKVTAPTDAEVQEIYEANKERLGDAPLETVKPRLVAYLREVKVGQQREVYLATLRGKYATVIALRPPVIEVGTGGRPSRGGAKAPIMIIEFSDYECPYCQKAEAAVDQVLKAYGDKVQLVYRDFPLEFHQHARGASLAARCAQAQGKFWEYHDKLFIRRELEPAKLKSLAGELGLEQKKFDECLDNQQFKADVEKDIEAGTNVGVTGTPTFFVNGRMLSGAVPFDDFKKVIDEELAQAGKGSGA